MKACFLRNKDTTCVFHRGVAHNPVLIIFEEPGIVEIELRRPITGRTGTNLCRLFHGIKKYGCYEARTSNKDFWFCVQRVAVLNALTEKKQVVNGSDRYGPILEALSTKSIVICFGKKAILRFKALQKSYFGGCTHLFSFCHLSTRGLSWLSIRDLKSEEREKVVLKEMAMFISRHLADKGNEMMYFSFENFLEESGCQWRDGLPVWGRTDYLSYRERGE